MLAQTFLQFFHLQVNDVLHLFQAEWREHDDLIDAVEELRPEGSLERLLDLVMRFALLIVRFLLEEAQGAAFTYIFGTQVGGHDQNRVSEVDYIALAVRHAPVVQDLQQRVPDFGMRLLDLIEQQDAIRSAADGFGQLTAFLVADVSGRRAEQSGHCVLLPIFGHIDSNKGILVVEHEPGQRLGQLSLADT